METCATCKFFFSTDGDRGECRRYPPQNYPLRFVALEHERKPDAAPELVTPGGAKSYRGVFYWTIESEMATAYAGTQSVLSCGEHERGNHESDPNVGTIPSGDARRN